MSNGIGTVSSLLSLTLGPSTGKVLVDNRRMGEPLDDGELLSQRLLELPDAFEDMGNQLMRKALAAVGRKSHDGTATCAVIAHAILRNAEPLLASGYDARQLMQEIAFACRHVLDAIDQRAVAIDSVEEVEAVLVTALVEPVLAATVADILGTVGPFGAVKVEESRLPDLAYEYVDGSRWTTRLASPYLLRTGTTVASVRDPVIVVSADPMITVDSVLPAIEAAVSSPGASLVLIAPSFSDQVISLLLVNRDRGKLEETLAITAPTSVHFGSEILDDIAAIVGATSPTSRARNQLQPVDLGSATEVWASMSAFGIVGGHGDAASIETRLGAVQRQAASESNTARKRQLGERAGTLAGLSALVRVPNRTAAYGEDRVRKVERALAIARQAVRDGVLPGSGTVLARCATELERDSPPNPGTQVLCRAIREPMSTILSNSGYSPGLIQHQLAERGGQDAFNVITGNWEDAQASGLLDAATTTRVALQTAVSAALMVISTETLVSRGAVDPNFNLEA
jgi:chaperonin GroEL